MEEKEQNKEVESNEIDLLQSPEEETELLTAPVVEEESTSKKKKHKKEKKQKVDEVEEVDNGKIFQKFKIKDIVFIAIMTACMLITGGVMPLVIHVPMFGIIHLALGIQCSLFPTIAMLKVRKPGTLFLMSVLFGLPLCAFQPIMCGGSILVGFITDVLITLIFRGYRKDAASITAGALFFPISLPLMYLYYAVMYTGEVKGEAVQAYVGAEPGFAVGISFAVLAICAVGAILGAVIFKELRKAGVIKK